MNGPLAALGPVEFLEAGDVAISAGGSITALAAHAFPTVGDFASGVVYATRDQSAEPLPADAHYVIATQGSSVVSPMEVHAEAPRELEQVTVNGVPLADLREISSGEPFDLTWSVGEAGDVVLVEVAFQDGAPSLLCAFRDDNGAGTVTTETVAPLGPASLAVHRTRIRSFERAVGFDTAELRFDFQRTTTVEFVE
jgi:hypothetical protein